VSDVDAATAAYLLIGLLIGSITVYAFVYLLRRDRDDDAAGTPEFDRLRAALGDRRLYAFAGTLLVLLTFFWLPLFVVGLVRELRDRR
jgi:hypothetical protein